MEKNLCWVLNEITVEQTEPAEIDTEVFKTEEEAFEELNKRMEYWDRSEKSNHTGVDSYISSESDFLKFYHYIGDDGYEKIFYLEQFDF